MGVSAFLYGVITMGFVIGALFFFRFWKKTRDSLFMAFGLAFILLALNQTLIAVMNVAREDQPWLYLPKLAAFGLLIVGILAKNRRDTRV
jgi:uncharacterized membrane protein YqgA involved in biofilm formation